MDVASPLLCAGITTYSPLKHWNVGPGKVAIVGVGGLGHLAIQFAHAMGAEVTVLSRSLNKKRKRWNLGQIITLLQVTQRHSLHCPGVLT